VSIPTDVYNAKEFIYIYNKNLLYFPRFNCWFVIRKITLYIIFFSFIGELFNKHVINPKIMQYCIAYLICQRSEEPIECLCNLLRISGKELEKVRINTIKNNYLCYVLVLQQCYNYYFLWLWTFFKKPFYYINF